jgi:hypothetical protein
MKKIILIATLVHLCFPVLSQTKQTIHIEEAGTLHTAINDSEKYEIEDLTLTGRLNGDDINFIRQMAGGSQFDGYTNGKLTKLNIEDAMIVQGGSYKSGGHVIETVNLEIGQRMFAYLGQLNSIILPKTTKAIGISAFYECVSLKNIIIPDNTFLIDYEAFRDCKSLEYVIIGKNLEKINSWTFLSCENLKYFIVHEENNYFENIDDILFTKNGRSIIAYPNAKSSEYVIPDDVITIGICAFAGCSSLESIYIPDNIVEIEDNAFYSCKNLNTVRLPENISRLSGTFEWCTSLTSITIPSKIQQIYGAFDWCESLVEIYCKSATPPLASFQGVNTIDCMVYVPKGSYNNYYRAEGWRNFLNIIETDFTSIKYPNTNFSVFGSQNTITIHSDIPAKVIIHSIDGKLIKTSDIKSGINNIYITNGIYIVSVNNETHKVIVE